MSPDRTSDADKQPLPARCVIAVASTKGGVGKTMTVSSLAYAFAQRGVPVTALDLDSSCDLTHGFSGLSVESGASTGAMLQGRATVDDITIEDLPGGVRLAPSCEIDQLTAELSLHASGLPGAFRLRDAICELQGLILVDTPGTTSSLFMNAVVAADWLVVPINSDADSIRHAGTVIHHVNEVRRYAGSNVKVLGLVRTKYEGNTNATAAGDLIAERLAAMTGVALLRTVLPTDTKYREARLVGLPVGQHAPLSRVATAGKLLADEILAAISNEQELT